MLPGPSTVCKVPTEPPGFVSVVPSLLCSLGTRKALGVTQDGHTESNRRLDPSSSQQNEADSNFASFPRRFTYKSGFL